MALDIWFKEDIANAVKAAHEAGSSSLTMFEQMTENSDLVRAYGQGYRSALIAVATAFGIELRNDRLKEDL